MVAINWRVREKIPNSWITVVLREFLKTQKLAKREISLAIVSPKESRKLNLRYRGKDKPTNVLSFPLDATKHLGEIILCLAIIKKESKLYRQPLKRYFQYILIHGLLHLAGFDHQTDAQTKKMIAAEKRLGAKL